MDQKQEVTGILGYLVTRWHDWRLTWNPEEWAGIEMFYINANEIWKPDLIMYNELNSATRNFTVNDQHQVRVWADRALMNDVEGEKFNIEWSPVISLELFHQYDNFYYPLDTQTVEIEIHPWMSISGYGQNRLKLISEAVTSITSQNPILFSEFIDKEDRYLLIKNSSKSWIYSYMWNDMEFNIMYSSFKLQRQDYKFFSVIYIPLVLLLILSTFNILLCTKDSRVRNSVMLLVSSTVYYTIFYNIVQHNTQFGLFESILYLNNAYTFFSNIMTMFEYYYESESDLIAELSKEYYDKGRILSDDTVSNRLKHNYKKTFLMLRGIDVAINLILIAVNIGVIGTQFKSTLYRYVYYTFIALIAVLIITFLLSNIKSFYISYLIYKIQYVHKVNSEDIDKAFLDYYSQYKQATTKDVKSYLYKIYHPYFKKKDIENVKYTLSLIVEQFDEDKTYFLDRKQLALLITSLCCDIKDLDMDKQNHNIVFNSKLEKYDINFNLETLDTITYDVRNTDKILKKGLYINSNIYKNKIDLEHNESIDIEDYDIK